MEEKKPKLGGLLKGCFEAAHLICPLKLLSIPQSWRPVFKVIFFSLLKPKPLHPHLTRSLPWVGFQLRVVEILVLKHRRLRFCHQSGRSHTRICERTTYVRPKSVAGWKSHQIIGSTNETLNPRMRASCLNICFYSVPVREWRSVIYLFYKCLETRSVTQSGEPNTANEGLPINADVFP